MRYFLGMIFWVLMMSGCGVVRPAPAEVEKQNAYLHHRTVQAAALQAKLENTSNDLQELTRKAATQSEAIVTYYGLPDELPAAETTADLLQITNDVIAKEALQRAAKEADWFAFTEELLGLVIAVAGVIGGAAGVKTVSALKTIRAKNTALKEIVQGNEFFKKRHAESAAEFKASQQCQSPATREIVATLKT